MYGRFGWFPSAFDPEVGRGGLLFCVFGAAAGCGGLLLCAFDPAVACECLLLCEFGAKDDRGILLFCVFDSEAVLDGGDFSAFASNHDAACALRSLNTSSDGNSASAIIVPICSSIA